MNVYFSTYLARFSSPTLCGLQCGQHFQLRFAKSRNGNTMKCMYKSGKNPTCIFYERKNFALARKYCRDKCHRKKFSSATKGFLASFEISFVKGTYKK